MKASGKNILFPTLVILFTASCGLIEVRTGPSATSARPTTSQQPKLEGTISIAHAWGQQLSPPPGMTRGIINLRNALVKWTDMDVSIEEHLRLDSNRIMSLPVLFITPDKAFELTSTERDNVGRYISAGGLLVLENPYPGTEGSQTEMALRKMARDVLGAQARFAPILNSHRLYSCFFTLDGPPQGIRYTSKRVGGDLPSGAPVNQREAIRKDVNYLEGITIGGRLAVVLSNKGYIQKWTEMSNNDPQLKMGINFVAYSLTEPGGIGTR